MPWRVDRRCSRTPPLPQGLSTLRMLSSPVEFAQLSQWLRGSFWPRPAIAARAQLDVWLRTVVPPRLEARQLLRALRAAPPALLAPAEEVAACASSACWRPWRTAPRADIGGVVRAFRPRVSRCAISPPVRPASAAAIPNRCCSGSMSCCRSAPHCPRRMSATSRWTPWSCSRSCWRTRALNPRRVMPRSHSPQALPIPSCAMTESG